MLSGQVADAIATIIVGQMVCVICSFMVLVY